MSNKALVSTLVEGQLITAAQLEKAKDEQRKSGDNITAILLKHGAVDPQAMREKFSDLYGFPAIDLHSFEIDQEALGLLTAEQCKKHTVIPVSKAGTSLVVAFADPTNIFVKDDIAFLTRCKIQPVVALDVEIETAIEKYYGKAGESAGDIITEMEAEAADGGLAPRAQYEI